MGTRGSDLARIQTEYALSLLAKSGIEEGMEAQTVRTSGDRNNAANPAEGSFVDSINLRIIEGSLDMGVHSMKDLPAQLPPELEIAAIPKRASRHDCTVGPAMLFRLPSGAAVGTSSPRRIAQLMRFRPDLRAVQLRGNVTKRISAVSAGKVNAAILALAGLERLNFSPSGGMGIYPLPLDHFVPAAGQGALAVVCRKGYLTQDVKRRATDRTTAGEVDIERRLLFELSAGCNKPLGISAVSFGRGYTIRLQLLSADGTKEAKLTAGVAADSSIADLISSFARIRMSRFGE